MAKRKGTNASETIEGTFKPDFILGLGGSDKLFAKAGADVIHGGNGSDRIYAGNGDDVIFGHSAADRNQSSGLIVSKTIADIGFGAVQVALSGSSADDGFIYALSKDSGQIFRINQANGNKSEFLDIPNGQIGTGGERGVLGMAFHPDYESNGRYFVYITNADGDIEVREYARGGGNSPMQTIITVPHPGANNHNGGSIAFGPDDMLYLGLGDGGGGGDPDGNAQNTDSLLGKILRIDIDGDDYPGDPDKNYAIPGDNPFVGAAGADEIWALGIRNPWRFSFDSKTGDFYIGDVGQNAWEEINYLAAGTAGGKNFGWNYREGDDAYEGTPPGGLTFTDPIFSYSHKGGSASVTGGIVTHADGGLKGNYVFSDFATGKFYTFRVIDGKVVDADLRSDQIRNDDFTNIVAYGEDGNGRLLAVSLNGQIMRLTPGATSGDGNDVLFGGNGNDRIFGGVGSDKLFGGRGQDRLDGGLGNDVLRGGGQSDVFVFKTGGGRDRILGFEATSNGHDQLDLSDLRAVDGFRDLMDNHLSRSGNDVIVTAGDDRVVLEGVKLGDLDRNDFIL